MPKYQFTAAVTISVSLDIEAASILEAMDLAREAPMHKLCHHCASAHAGQWSASELDADPESSELVDLFVDGKRPENYCEIKAAWACEGHECPTAPLGRCVYDEDEDPANDDCIHCHQPYERK